MPVLYKGLTLEVKVWREVGFAFIPTTEWLT